MTVFIRYFFTLFVFLLSSISNAQSITSEPVSAPNKASHARLISAERAKELSRNYNEKIINFNKGEVTSDANAVWYSIKELEDYFSYVKKEGTAKGYEVNGIRFYYGSYPVTEKDGRAGLTTLFLSPTGNLAHLSEASKTIEGDSNDIAELSPLNFGTMGNPPKIEYGAQAITSDRISTSKKGSHARLVSVERAKELSRNYNEKILMFNRAEVSSDANAVWYSIKELEDYIAYIKKEGAEKGYEVNGIRFYYGSYPVTEKEGRAGLTTLFLSPTGNLVHLNETSKKIEGDSNDITELSPLNYGGMGHPPKIDYMSNKY